MLQQRVGPGSLTSRNNFEFVTKFVFNYNPIPHTVIGNFEGTITTASASYFVVYDDEPFSWSSINHNATLSCDWALTTKQMGGPAKHKWHLPAGKPTKIKLFIMEKLRPRIWYFAIVDEKCQGSNRVIKNSGTEQGARYVDLSSMHFVAGMEELSSTNNSGNEGLGLIQMDVTFINSEQGWQEQFGFDEYGVLPGSIALLVVYIALFIYQLCTEGKRSKHVMAAGMASSRRRHYSSSSTSRSRSSSRTTSHDNSATASPLVRIWSILVIFQISALLLRTYDLFIYASKGATSTRWHWGKTLTVNICSHSLDLMGRLGLTLAVFLVARGWTITSGPGEVRGKVHVLIMFGVTCFVEIGGHIWISLTYDPSSTLYGYSSFAGSIVVGWRWIQLVWFLINIATTFFQEREQKRRRLYMVFGTIFSLWFVSLPGVVLTVSNLIAPHYRYKIVRATVDVVHFVALTSYGLIFWPSWSSQYFEIRASPQSIEEQNQLLGTVETNHRGSPGWSFDVKSPFYQKKNIRGGSYGDDGL